MVLKQELERAKKNLGPGIESNANSIIIPISGWSALGPGFASGQPDVNFINPLLRRRLSPMDRAALHVANACLEAQEKMHMIFASRHGELNRSTDLLMEIAGGELPSPINFCLSVLNAVPGLYAIARQDTSPATAISAGEATFAIALIEAAAHAWQNPKATVLLVCADDPPPAIYFDEVQSPREFYAVAIRMQAMRVEHPVRCSWIPEKGCGVTEDSIHFFMNCLTTGTSTCWSGPDHLWRWQREYGQT